MACYVCQPEYIKQFYIDEKWIEYDRIAKHALRLFHLLDAKGSKDSGLKNKIQKDVMEYMQSVYQHSQDCEYVNAEVYYREEVKFYTLRQLDKIGLDISAYVDKSMMSFDEWELEQQALRYAEATPQSMIDGCKNRIKKIEQKIGKCFSYAIETFDLETTEVEEERYIIDGLLMENNLAYLTGAAKTGKSFMLEEMLFCIENGLPWQGRDGLQTHCILIDFELTKAKLVKRWRKLKEKYAELYPGYPFRAYDCVSMVGSWGTGSVTLDIVIEFVRDMKKRSPGLGVVALDPFYRFAEGDENSNEDVQETISKLMPLKQEMTVIYTHHTKKNSTDRDPLTNGSGAGSHGRAADICMSLSGDNAKGFELKYSGREDYGSITLWRDAYGFFLYDATKDSEKRFDDTIDEDTLKQINEYVGNRVISMTAFRNKFGNISYNLLRAKDFIIEKEKGNMKIKKKTVMRTKEDGEN